MNHNTNTSSQPPRQPEPLKPWPKTEGDFTESEAIELVQHLNALAQYNAEVAQWQHDEKLRTQREIELLFRIFRPALQRYLAQHGDPETQSLQLESGRIWMAKEPEQLCIEDKAAALTWAMKYACQAVDVTIALNGSFDALLSRFMRKELPFYFREGIYPNGHDVYSRTVNLARLEREWREMSDETSGNVPDGCKLLPAESHLVVSPNERRSRGGHTSLPEPRGDDDDH